MKKEILYVFLFLVFIQIFSICGDGILEEGEECDDGNNTNGDGCNSECEIETNVYGKKMYSCSGSPSVCTYISPLGIPNPPFGVKETRNMYKNQPGYSFDSQAGVYTIYVNNLNQCSDSSESGSSIEDANEKSNSGTPTLPRCTIPLDLESGSVVVVDGGSYSYTSKGDYLKITGKGTKEKPIFISGINNPIINGNDMNVLLSSPFLVFEGFRVGTFPKVFMEEQYQVVRNCDIFGDGVWTWDSLIYPKNNFQMIFNCKLHDKGDWQASTQNDAMGVVLTQTENVWVLDNEIYHVGGDGVGNCHAGNHNCKYWFIGRNKIYENLENAVDVKEIEFVVVSENEFYGFHKYSSVTIHRPSDNSGWPPSNVWIIFNTFYDHGNGISASLGSNKVYVIGNVFINDPDGKSFYSSKAYKLFFVGNTMLYGVHMYFTGAEDSDYSFPECNGAQIVLENNLIYEMNEKRVFLFADKPETTYLANSIVRSNLFYSSIYKESEFVSTVECSNCIYGNPDFKDEVTRDFTLDNNSSAIGKGRYSEVYDIFESTFKSKFLELDSKKQLNIRCDMNRNYFKKINGLLDNDYMVDIGAFQIPRTPTDYTVEIVTSVSIVVIGSIIVILIGIAIVGTILFFAFSPKKYFKPVK